MKQQKSRWPRFISHNKEEGADWRKGENHDNRDEKRDEKKGLLLWWEQSTPLLSSIGIK
jgi:hypothetical protein